MMATLRGVRLGYDDQGQGVPVVFLHGFPHDRQLWAAQRDALADRARCIVPDLRGFGESEVVGPYSMDQYADDVASLLEWLEIPSAVICGLSMGGYIAMALWRRHPQRVRGLILCDTKATADSATAQATRNELIALVQQAGVEALVERQLPGMVGKSTRTLHPEIVAQMRSMMVRQSAAGVIGALAALRDRPDSQSTLASITVPVLVLVGEEDVLTPFSDAQAMVDLLPLTTPTRLEWITHAGHVPCVERPSAVTHLLADFLSMPSLSSL